MEMSEPSSARPNYYLGVQWPISIALIKSIAERLATVMKTASDETWVQLSRPTLPLIFKKGEQVRIKHWEEESIYYWGGEVLKIVGPENQNIAISISGEGMTLGRRKYSRFCSGIPFSYRVLKAAPGGLVPEKVNYRNKILNISVGGIAFETYLPLIVGDELQVKLDLSASEQVNAAGWVVRSEPVKRQGKDSHSVALEFLGLAPEEQKQIQRFLASSRYARKTKRHQSKRGDH